MLDANGREIFADNLDLHQ